MPVITVALDGSLTRNLRMSPGDEVTLSLVVYEHDGDETPIAYTNPQFSTGTGGFLPIGDEFTVSCCIGRMPYRLAVDIAGVTTTVAHGFIESELAGECSLHWGFIDYGMWLPGCGGGGSSGGGGGGTGTVTSVNDVEPDTEGNVDLAPSDIGAQPADDALTQIAELVDPGADRIMFWDDSEGEWRFLTLGTNLSITDDTLNAAGGGGGAVDSVNGQTGDVVLTSADVGAQPDDAELTAIAGLTSAADRLPYFTGLGTAALAVFTSFGRTMLAWVDAAAARTGLGLGTLATQNGTFSGTSSGTNTGDQTSVTGNAGTATALQTSRNIFGQSFNGTANVAGAGAFAGTANTATVAGSTTGNPVTITATGSDTNIDVNVVTKGSGVLKVNGVAVGGGGGVQVMVVQDEKASGTNGGTGTAATFIQRNLNTVVSNSITGASLSSNQVTLPAGTYLFQGMTPVGSASLYRCALVNVTDSTYSYGMSQRQTGVGTGTTFVSTVLTIASSKVFELETYVSASVGTSDFGQPVGIAGVNEVYSVLTITKIA